MSKYVIVTCPHCENYIQVFQKDYNCRIFRHGILRTTLKQINPHLQKSECDRLKRENLIYGCGKPFKLVTINGQDTTIKCDYI